MARLTAAGTPTARPAPRPPVGPSHELPPGAPPGAAAAAARGTARGAYAAFLAFILAVHTSVAQLVPALAPLAPGQTLIAGAAAALAWSCLLCDRPFRLALAGGGLALHAFFAVLAISPAWSLWPRQSAATVLESVKYLPAAVIAANVLDSERRVRGAVIAIVLGSLAPALGALHSEVTGAHAVEGTRAAWIGAFGNPNFLAYHLVVATPLALALRDATPPGRGAALARAGWLAIAVLLAVAVLLTGSRGGTVGLAAVYLLWLARGLARGRIALGGAAAITAAVLLTPGGPWDRAETHATLAGRVDASAQGRLDAWRTALRIVEDRPGLGVGAGAFVQGYERYAPGDAGPARTAHNSFLLVAAELGLPALLLFGAALAGASAALGRRARAPGGAVARGAQTALFGFVICSLTGGYAFSWPLVLLLGLAGAVAANQADDASPPSPARPRALATGARP